MSNTETPSHPRPLLRRSNWTSLDGPWQFGIGEDAGAIQQTINVPFAPECAASGIEAKGYFTRVWYRRTFDVPNIAATEQLWLHFEAADYVTQVWVNGEFIGQHEGGYTRFSFDISKAVAGKPTAEILVCCDDDPHDLSKPRGKQDWLEQPHAIWYQRTTGLWQTVWLEVTPKTRIANVRWTPSVADWTLRLDAVVAGRTQNNRVRVETRIGDRVLSDDTFAIDAGKVARSIHLPDGGIDSVREEFMWFHWRPTLIDVVISLLDGNNNVVDRIESYTALRSVATQGDRFMLNGRAVELRLVLDQGYWEHSGLTASDDAALRKDIELVKALGFNGVRKHQKIETERFLYWADKMGLFVWEEMPSPYAFSPDTIRRTTTEWLAALERDVSHPCIIAWVPINESWGVPDLPLKKDQRAFADALYQITKGFDPTRPVVSNDGWEITHTDLINVHDYDHDPQRLKDRYDATKTPTGEMLLKSRPGNRLLVLDETVYTGQPMLLTEFGGIALSSDTKATWGYSRATSSDDLAGRYARLLTAVRACPAFSGFCYTQFTDTYQEANGLLYMDRTPKADLAKFSVATRGPANPEETRQLQALLDAGK